jgi:periplasmic divalent cation tolerance protein
MKFILIYVTYKDSSDAEKSAEQLLDKKLIACANFFPISSMYKWKGSIERSNETVAILKTRVENWESVKGFVLKNHSYETPCVIKLAEVEANDSYTTWILNETK